MNINPLLTTATHGAISRKARVPRTDCGYRDNRFIGFWLFGWDWMDDQLANPRVNADLLDESAIMAQLTTAVAEARAQQERFETMPVDRLVIWLIRLARGEGEP